MQQVKANTILLFAPSQRAVPGKPPDNAVNERCCPKNGLAGSDVVEFMGKLASIFTPTGIAPSKFEMVSFTPQVLEHNGTFVLSVTVNLLLSQG